MKGDDIMSQKFEAALANDIIRKVVNLMISRKAVNPDGSYNINDKDIAYIKENDISKKENPIREIILDPKRCMPYHSAKNKRKILVLCLI